MTTLQSPHHLAAPGGNDRRAYALTYLALVLSLAHHLDHVVRGNHVGWPVTSEVTPFTYSLAIYPLILLGLVLSRTGRVGAGYWLLLSGPGALFVLAVHFGPLAVEPPRDIVEPYEPSWWGWLAVAELLLFLAVLVTAFGHELRLWRAHRPHSR